MKFTTKSVVRSAARVGTLTGFSRLPEANFETPTVLIYTKTGCVPHLTKDVFKTISAEPQLLSVPLSSTIGMLDSINELKTSFSSFVSMSDHIHFLSIYDPVTLNKQGIISNDVIGLWNYQGRYKLSVESYMTIVESFKPDFYTALCDADINISSTKKRIDKAVCRTNSFLDQCISKHASSNALKSTGILASVQGGYDLECRKKSTEFLANKLVSGYIIDGLHSNGPNTQNIKPKEIRDVLQYTINQLPADKLKISLGSWHPITLLELVNSGVDLFDSTYAYLATENHKALTFLCNDDCCNKSSLSISEERYKDDFTPICKQCACLTCQDHTRAYVNHLCNTKEMLRSVLLMIHNTHHYLQFFRTIRENIKMGTFHEFQEKMCAKFSNDEDVIKLQSV